MPRLKLVNLVLAATACLALVSCHSPKASSSKQRSPTLLAISERDVPFTKTIILREGDAYRLKLPNDQEIAFWCVTQDFPVGEQTTRSGLDMMWGERPLRHSPVVYEYDPTADAQPTHIKFGGVLTTGSSTSTSSFKIGAWRVTLTEDISSTNGLPLTVTVE